MPCEYIKEHEIASLHIVHVIIKKYIAVLIKLIWRKEIGKTDIVPSCFQNYVTKGFYEIDLDDNINTIVLKYGKL